MMRFVAGLGNPGDRYRMTWHNAGFWVADILAAEQGVSFTNAGLFEVAGLPSGFDVIKPCDFMNRSGAAVRVYLEHVGCDPSSVLVVCDDANLPLGTLRLRGSGSHGGHKGLRSIIEKLGTDAFPRLRLGIGSPPGGVGLREYVLTRVPAALQAEASRMANRAAECVMCYADRGLEAAQNIYNRRETEEEG